MPQAEPEVALPILSAVRLSDRQAAAGMSRCKLKNTASSPILMLTGGAGFHDLGLCAAPPTRSEIQQVNRRTIPAVVGLEDLTIGMVVGTNAKRHPPGFDNQRQEPGFSLW